MPKGHLILAAVLLAVMLAVPAVAIPGTGTATDAPRPAADGAGAGQTVKVLRADTGTVETVTWHNYVFGVMAAESDPAQPDAALQAQAVAACTLALYRRAQRQTDPPAALQGADVTDDSGVDQGYITRPVARAKWGAKADAYERRLDELVAGVLGWVLTYEGQPAMAVYHAVSAGRTESALSGAGGKRGRFDQPRVSFGKNLYQSRICAGAGGAGPGCERSFRRRPGGGRSPVDRRHGAHHHFVRPVLHGRAGAAGAGPALGQF